MKLLGVSASPSVGSKTMIALTTAMDHAASAHPDVATEILNVREHDVVFCDGRDPASYEGDTRTVIDKVVDADALIIATPIYRGSYTGILKNLADLLPNDALQGKVVGLLATAGSDHHFLVIEHELKPLIGFFHGHAVPGGVYLHNGHFSGGALVDEGILERLRQLAESVVVLSRSIPRTGVGADRPSITRKSLAQT